MRRSSKRKLKKIAICLAVITLSPFVAAWAIKSLPAISVFAGKVVTISAGINLGERLPEPVKQQEIVHDDTEDFLFDDSYMISKGSPEIIGNETVKEQAKETDGDIYIGPLPYPEKIDTNSGKITSLTFLKQEGTNFFSLKNGGQVRNTTEIDMGTLMMTASKMPDIKIEKSEKEGEMSAPQVLIMHTHTTESYEPYARDFYDLSFSSRTTQENMNMIAVGNEIAKGLEEAGIGVIHDTNIHDYPSYNGSYDRSRATVKAILDKNPSIKVVLDIHRDAIEREGGERIAPVATIDGKQAAQIMIISGCDNGNMNYPNYLENFKLASLFQQQIETDYPSLTRPVLFTYKKYNQDLTTGSLLIEVGGHANSIDQALYSGQLLGKSIANALKQLT